MDEGISALLSELPQPDEAAAARVRERAARMLRPAGALARLDEVAVWLAGWQRTIRPRVEAPAAVVFVADHGVATERVSAYPPGVTAEMLRALRDGAATAAVMARTLEASLSVVDVGVGRPCGNILREDALTEARFHECFDVGRQAVAGIDTDLLVLGEMGIGNTTPASAVCVVLFGGPAEKWTGRGTGIDDVTYARKVSVVEQASRRIGDQAGPLDVLRQVGGSELVALVGALVEARLRSVPVVLDGFVVTAACAAVEAFQAGAVDHCLAGHCSEEPGHRLLLRNLGKEPLLDLRLRLGEGSGALAAVPLVKLAAACATQVVTFEEWGLSR
ncbi:MAG TPA: nicotinate-nucleotide--dimethylbenzimidazole phosphoribosyltransferase [Actinomycetota bacterium]|nr:nicotinate-nucleotide--dimethylbenzimidazole phosphoribosyltransferase [Actinomycetota bacterium]